MGLFSRVFRFRDSLKPNKTIQQVSPEYDKLLSLKGTLELLTSGETYVARSAYMDIIKDSKNTSEFFHVLQRSSMLDSFCARHGADPEMVANVIDLYDNFEERVDEANERFIQSHLESEKDYLDGILKDVDPVIMLDDDQRRVILTDEDYCLVIAGAGAGKTTTVAAKVRYLVEKQGINPKDILVISFTNKAVGELREKINKDLRIDCPITTFHSTGNAILRINNSEPLNICDNSKLYYVLQDYFKQSILTNETLVNNLILFFASYFEAPYEGADLNEFFNKTAKANFATMRSELDEFRREVTDARTKKKVTIQNEVLRSYQEVQIANFLYLNGIDYEYEPIYPYNITCSRKPYTPDFIIKQGEKTAYLEHFGITEDGKNDRFTEEENARYRKAINDKVLLHRRHGTALIYTFSAFKDGRNLLEHLKEKLEAAGFKPAPRSNREVMEKLISTEESKYIRKLLHLICRFIVNFKTNGYEADEFDRMYHSTSNVRSRLFLNICQDCYLEYQRYLKENNLVDFEDMINESARVLRNVKEMKERLRFKYIIVDEYQDISRQRFDLTTALSEVCDGKIIAVGDDWQSIYAFSGSDISLFTGFQEKMGYAKLLKIVRTYRNAQDVIDIAGGFVQKNPTQITKSLISPKTIQDPVIIYTYDNSYKKQGQDRRGGALYATAKAVETALEQIIKYSREEGRRDPGTILILGRYGFDGDYLERSGLFEYKVRGSRLKCVRFPKLDITFMTVHVSKGLGYDNVIVVNGKNETYGFPSKIEDDPVLSFVIKGDRSIDYAEERRLFYVAMTRTKNRVYFIAPEQNPSEFLLEIKRDYTNVDLRGKWNEKEQTQTFEKKTCPICGYPLQYRYKNAYGLRLYICTNEQEVCGFMTNDMNAGNLSIMKCDKCRDGYLVARRAGKDYFLGCTNYKSDRTGCSNSVSRNQYAAIKNVEFTPLQPIPSASRVITTEEIEEEQNREAREAESLLSRDSQDSSIQITEQQIVTDATDTPETIPTEPKRKNTSMSGICYRDLDVYNIAGTIVSCHLHISEDYFFGMTVLIGVLRGQEMPQIKKRHLEKTEEYGALKAMTPDEVENAIEWLIDHHYLYQTKGQYPVLHPTYESIHFEECISRNQLIQLKAWLERPF